MKILKFHENPEIFMKFPSSPYVNCSQTQQKIIDPAEIFSTTPTCTSKRCYSDVVRRDLSIEHGFRSIRAMVEKIWSDLGPDLGGWGGSRVLRGCLLLGCPVARASKTFKGSVRFFSSKLLGPDLKVQVVPGPDLTTFKGGVHRMGAPEQLY